MQLPIIFTLLMALAHAAPMPKIVTAVVTAQAVTVTQDTTVQTTITVPVEEVIIVGDHTVTTSYNTILPVADGTTPGAIYTTHSNAEPTLVGIANISGPGYNEETTTEGAVSATEAAQATTGTETTTFNAETTAGTTTNAEVTTSSTSIAEKTTTSSSSSSTEGIVIPGVTTLPVGESFISSLSGMVLSDNVIPTTIALTTTTVPEGETVTTSTGLHLEFSTTNGKAVLPALTEGLQRDTQIANTMVNPATVSITNESAKTIVTPTYTPTTLSTSTTSATSADSSDDTTSTSADDTASTSSTSAAQTSGLLTKVPQTIVYSPYTNSGGCKSYSTVAEDLQLIKSKGIYEIRVYGTDCNYTSTILPIAASLGIKVNQGFWISDAGVDSITVPVTNFIEAVNAATDYDWTLFSFITIGNEAIISNYCTVDELIAKIATVKSQLRTAGYTGKVTTSEPPVSFENNPELCTDSEIDFVGINPHSYFAPTYYAYQAGVFVKGQVEIVQSVCPGMDIFVTETGYPHGGDVNGNNDPTPENQLIALQSIFDDYGTDVTILTTFDDLWKQPGQYNIEQKFGMIDLLPTV